MSFITTNSNGPSVKEQLATMDDSTIWLQTAAAAAAAAATTSSESSNDDNNNTAEPSSLCKGLKELEDELRCTICGEFMRNPVSVLPCQHTFCSNCIRQYFADCLNPPAGCKRTKRLPNCAHCSQLVDTSGRDYSKCLVPNWAVGRQIKIFCAIRSDLKHAVVFVNQQQQQQQQQHQHNQQDSTAAASKDDSHENALRRSSRHSNSNSSSSSPHHQQQQQQQPQLQPKAKVAYASLKKTQLQQLCAKEGLYTAGTEKELKERHRDWITFYNAECRDAQHPRSLQQLRTAFSQEERARKTQQKRETSNKILQRQRDAFHALADPNSQQAKDKIRDPELDQAMQCNWQSLIAKAKEGMKKAKAKNKNKNTVFTHESSSSKDNKNNNDASDGTARQHTHTAAASLPDQDIIEMMTDLDNNDTLLPQENKNVPTVYDLTLSSSSSSINASDNNSISLLLVDARKPAASNKNAAKCASQPLTAVSSSTAAAAAAHTQSTTSTLGNQRTTTTVTSLPASASTELSTSSSSSSETDDVSPNHHNSHHNAPSNKKRKAALRGNANKSRSATQQTLTTVTLSRNNSNNDDDDDDDVDAAAAAAEASKKRPRRNAPSIIGPWSCPSCTYYNIKFTFSTAKCEVCDFPRNEKLPASNTNASDATKLVM